jgi:broad specificity phosphatase PhoE
MEYGRLREAVQKLILIKHAPPAIVPGTPPEQWKLSENGRALCIPLAEAIAPHQPTVIVSSEEPKAAETAQLVAERLGIPWRTAPGLHEHDRSNVPHMRTGEFISAMELFFRRPNELVLGKETAAEAKRRFATAVSNIAAIEPDGNVAIVSHGTVIALLLEQDGQTPPFQIWRAMGLPSLAVLALPSLAAEGRIDRIG